MEDATYNTQHSVHKVIFLSICSAMEFTALVHPKNIVIDQVSQGNWRQTTGPDTNTSPTLTSLYLSHLLSDTSFLLC